MEIDIKPYVFKHEVSVKNPDNLNYLGYFHDVMIKLCLYLGFL